MYNLSAISDHTEMRCCDSTGFCRHQRGYRSLGRGSVKMSRDSLRAAMKNRIPERMVFERDRWEGALIFTEYAPDLQGDAIKQLPAESR